MSVSESQRYLDLQAARSNLQPPLAHLTDRERQALAAFVDRIRQRFDGLILSAVLFGSRAQGEASADSDVDVLVMIDKEDYRVRKEIRYLAAEVWLDMGFSSPPGSGADPTGASSKKCGHSFTTAFKEMALTC